MQFNGWDIYWIAWFLIGFGIPEFVALYRAQKYHEYGNTLSENVREWFSTDLFGWKDTSGWSKVRRLLLFIGMGWLILHWFIPGIF